MRFKQEVLLFYDEKFAYGKLLFIWKNSLWRLMIKDVFLLWLFYILISIIYRYYIIHLDYERIQFEQFLQSIRDIKMAIPLEILLGFFISAVLGRYWSFVDNLPNENTLSFFINATIKSWNAASEKVFVHFVKRVIIRQISLAWLIHMMQHSWMLRMKFCYRKKIFRSIYERLKSYILQDKFTHATMYQIFENINSDPIVRKYMGVLITKGEIQIYRQREVASKRPTYFPEWWLPIKWINATLNNRFYERYTRNDESLLEILGSIQSFRQSLEFIERHHYFTIPRIYIQTVVIIVHVYFVAEIFSVEILEGNYDEIRRMDLFDILNTFIPIVSLYRFILYMGWFRMGLNLVNPLDENHSKFNTLNLFEQLIVKITYINVSSDRESPSILNTESTDFKLKMEQQFEQAFSEAKNIAWISAMVPDIWPCNVDWKNIVNIKMKNDISQLIDEKESLIFLLRGENKRFEQLYEGE